MSSQLPEIPDPESWSAENQPAWGPGPAPGQPPAWGGQRPASTAVNPFAGLPREDLVRDILAFVLLIWSLFLPWDYAGNAGQNVAVLLITILSVLSLAVTYLARSGIVRIAPQQTRTLRLALNVPYVVIALVYIIIDIFVSEAPREGLFGYGEYAGRGGVGNAIAIGLAAVVLAGQPRRHELRAPAQERELTKAWRLALAGAGVWIVLASVLSFILWLVGKGVPLAQMGAWYLIPVVLLQEVGLVAIACYPAYRAYHGSVPWRIVTVMVGAVTTVSLLFSLVYLMGGGFGGVETVQSAVASSHMSTLAASFIPMLGAIAFSPALDASLRAEEPAAKWAGAGRASLWVTMAYGAITFLAAFVMVLVMAVAQSFQTSVLITALLAVAALAAAGYGWQAAGRPAGNVRTVMLGMAAVLAIVGLLGAILASTGVIAMFGALDMIALFGPAVLIAYAYLFVPGLRAPAGPPAAYHYGGVPDGYGNGPGAGPSVAPAPGAGKTAAQGPGARGNIVPPPPPPPPPAPRPAAPPKPELDPVALEAADPGTSQARLAEIAHGYPEHRAAVAANPSCYPALADWIASRPG